MGDVKPEVRGERFSLSEKNVYLLFGIWEKNAEVLAEMGGRNLPVSIGQYERITAADRLDLEESQDYMYAFIKVELPDAFSADDSLVISAVREGHTERWFKCQGKDLEKKLRDPQFYIDQTNRKNRNTLTLNGWVASAAFTDIRVFTPENTEIKTVQVRRFERRDVEESFEECAIDKKAGFSLLVNDIRSANVVVKFINENGESSLTVPMSSGGVKLEKLKSYFKKTVTFVKQNGIAALPRKVINKLSGKNEPVSYMEWRKHNEPSAEELEAQKKVRFACEPVISVVVPLYKTSPEFLKMLVDSVKNQTYSNWQLVLSDGSGENSPLTDILNKLAASDKRIKVLHNGRQLRICENTNAGIEAADGEFIAFADHDDELSLNALFEVVKAINENDKADLIYSDEDKTDISSADFFEPHMKPDFNIDLLRTVNYISHLSVIRKSFLMDIGLLNPEYEGAQDYELTLRAIEKSEHIVHIPKVLYHWRSYEESTAENPESKRYAFEAGRRAVSAHYERVGINAEVMEGEWQGLYRTRYIRSYDPLISIIIPNKDHIKDLKRCIDAIDSKSTYKNYEYVIIENNSVEEETFAYYKELERTNSRVHMVYYEGTFNYSLINNYGVRYANGEYFLFLNNDTEMINPDCLEELLGYCMRDDVGAVGARLYYDDRSIQHAGVVIGFGGIAGHCFVMHPKGATGYFHRIISAQDYSAVTAACVLIKRSVFEEVGGFFDGLAVAFNDIDLCMKIRQKGYLIVYNPYAELYHYESKSRGLEDTPEKVARFNTEIELFAERWPEILKNGDPYYNPNLTLDSQDFSLKKNF